MGKPRIGYMDHKMAAAEKLLKVGELAKVAGKTVRAMHLYEEMGLVKPSSRSAGGDRLYFADAALRVNWIAKLQEMGFSLQQIQVFLRDWEGASTGPEAMSRVRDAFLEKLKNTREARSRLQLLERDLELSLAYLEGCTGCEPTRHQAECACCDHHGHRPESRPALVAGLAQSDYDVPLDNLKDGHLKEGMRQ